MEEIKKIIYIPVQKKCGIEFIFLNMQCKKRKNFKGT